MHNFYFLPEAVRVAVSLTTIINAAIAALVLVLHQYRFKRGFSYWLVGAAALLALCQAVVCVALIAQAQQNVYVGFIVPSRYILLRYAVFAALAAVCFITVVSGQWSVVGRRWQRVRQTPYSTLHISHFALFTAAASFLTLPVMESWAGRAFPAAFAAALLLLLFSGVWIMMKIRRELQTDVSGLSVMEAMDSLDTAIMFYHKSGHILLMNRKMQELMIKTAGRVVYNGRLYLETVVIPNSESTGKDSYLYRVGYYSNTLPQNGAKTPHAPVGSLPTLHTPHSNDGEWLFTIMEKKIGGRLVAQLTATDITEQNRVNLILREKQTELESQQDKLKSFLENIEENSRTGELLRIKTELHAEQNEKLAVLLQYLRYGQTRNGESPAIAGASILRGAKKMETASAQPEVLLDAIATQYESIGVKIIVTGELPFERDIAAALVQILREAAANAVMHGVASEIHAEIATDVNEISMRVTDNSGLPPKELREGSGIAGMRSCAEKLGGSLEISTVPRFTVAVKISLTTDH